MPPKRCPIGMEDRIVVLCRMGLALKDPPRSTRASTRGNASVTYAFSLVRRVQPSMPCDASIFVGRIAERVPILQLRGQLFRTRFWAARTSSTVLSLNRPRPTVG